jgi:hypothetical protein
MGATPRGLTKIRSVVAFCGLLAIAACLRSPRADGTALRKGTLDVPQENVPPNQDSSNPPAAIDEASARKLFVDRYRRLFSDKYYRNAADGKYHQLPALDSAALDVVELSASGWRISATPPAGLSVEGRVDRSGHWVAIESVSFAIE